MKVLVDRGWGVAATGAVIGGLAGLGVGLLAGAILAAGVGNRTKPVSGKVDNQPSSVLFDSLRREEVLTDVLGYFRPINCRKIEAINRPDRQAYRSPNLAHPPFEFRS